MKSERWKAGGFVVIFYKKESRLFLGDIWEQNNFSFSRMNIFFSLVLVVRLEIWDGMGGTAEKAETFFFLLGGFLFLFLFISVVDMAAS